jgi:OmcA/MtrC family decaheme c-type cytochrome
MRGKLTINLWMSTILALVLVALAGWVFATPVAAQDQEPPDPHVGAMISAEPESCSVCHKEAGAKHQASYDELYQDGVIQIADLAYRFAAPDTSTVTFKMTKNGEPFDARQADSLAIYFAPYTGTKFQFEPAAGRLSLKGALVYDGEGVITTSVTGTVDFSSVNGLVVVYGADETVGNLPARIRQVKYPFAALLETGAGVDYVSAANNDGCEKCHTDPYLKHGYIYSQVNNDPATDFYTCKACHLDNGEGGHFEWQLMVDDPLLAAAVLAGEVELTAEQEEQYAYPTTLMNDVHMSHAMEFPYPQSMANCVTCHAGKLDATLADANFNVATCKSCHPVTGSEEYETAEFALQTLLGSSRDHEDMDLNTEDCTRCHAEGEKAPTFRDIHSGYNKAIFTADGLRYSEAISVTIDNASFDGAILKVSFSAAESPDIGRLDVADILPTVMVGLYGYDTKDFIIGAHERLFDDNGDGVIDRNDQRAVEFVVGEEHPRFTTEFAGEGRWQVTADLSAWADLYADGTVKRIEIAVMPELMNADDVQIALNAPSRTFDLAANGFVDDFYSPIAKVADGCNNCHEALATTFHSPDRGGNLVTCRMCHITKSGGSHLELQSRSLDSYTHAIHSFQAFDIGDIDFNDPVQAMHYEHHIEFPFPTHSVTNCESCHYEGVYNVPDQSKSLPGLLSATDPVEARSIGTLPQYITGPAARACGGCHRAELIKEDAVSELVSLNQHMKREGYLINAGETPAATLATVIEQIMAYFK